MFLVRFFKRIWEWLKSLFRNDTNTDNPNPVTNVIITLEENNG